MGTRKFVASVCLFVGLLSPAVAVGVTDDEPPLPVGAPATKPADNEPALPAGAPGGDEPALPTGAPGDDEPPLPTGLAPTLPETGTAEQDETKPDASQWLQQAGLSGFLDVRGGIRTQRDPHSREFSLGEARLQLDWQKTWEKITFKVVADIVGDTLAEHRNLDFGRGQGWLDLRQANVSFRPTRWMDVKAGRQILTWGTGDLLFINDLFPKDWQAFFIGRDVEYLKAPSDAVKVGFYSDIANLDVVYMPQFDPDRHITGERVSYYSGSLGRLAGRADPVRTHLPDDCFQEDEWAARLYRNVEGYELAAYGYWGYWKSPGGLDSMTGRATFPRLAVYGASARGQVGAGIGNLEVGYYDSRDDRDGDKPFINNSQVRLLAGYERDLPMIAQDLTVGVQYYVEFMVNHGDYLRSVRAVAPGSPTADHARQVVTLRVTKLLMNQNLNLSLFTYYSPTDADAYLRPHVSYKIDDHWTAEVGGNVFIGRQSTTFFGQFRNNSNIFAALRYSF